MLQKARGINLTIEILVISGNFGFEIFQKINHGHEYFTKKSQLQTDSNLRTFKIVKSNYIIALSEKSRFWNAVDPFQCKFNLKLSR